MDCEMKDFDFNLVIKVWFFGVKIKRYVMKKGYEVLVVVFIDGLFVSEFFKYFFFCFICMSYFNQIVVLIVIQSSDLYIVY